MASPVWVAAAQRLIEKRLWVLGYTAEDYPEDQRSLESMRHYHTHFDAIAHFAYFLREDTSLQGELDPTLIRESFNYGVSPLVLIHNFNGQIFDPQPLRSLLSSLELQERFMQNLLNLLPNGVAGVHIDFEGMEASYRLAYTSFLESLRITLHTRGFLLTIAVPAKRSEWEAPGYDFAAIGRTCDAITLMTYDEHYSGGEAGAIASLPWMTQALDYAIQYIPHQKILVGIPVYGFDWSNGSTIMIPMNDISTLIKQTGARILWSDPAVEPYFYYWQGRTRHTVWYESELSSKIRLGFVKSYRLRGIAIWRLGYETNRFWQAIDSKLK
ncbi:glycosyl hydrolase family 18 protein [Desulfitobacterium sp.]|uniref:glycosyl hydrolase family 18 protein n=1 Tax=Desulfitobacterium sp. TaxID=49981 RepID=UPI002CC851C0|nr:glycosyl hydrolase family 18 protein [Desulfitobacterium sp.]HVJ50414.1 glycosyl hydrolase family 18 protein [Desulfitobacterium sp.]